MVATFRFQHDPKNGTFIYVRHHPGLHTGYAIGHEYLNPPHLDSRLTLYMWDSKEPLFVGRFGRITAYWEDSIDIAMHASFQHYHHPEPIPPSYLLHIPLDLIQISTIQAVIQNSHLRSYS